MSEQKQTISKIGIYIMFVTGLSLLVVSGFLVSSFIAMIGLGIAFWGAILLYISPVKQVSLALLNASSNANSSNIERFLNELSTSRKGVYIPPKNLSDVKSSLVYLPINDKVILPSPGESLEKLYSKQKKAVFLTPPGLALSQLFEKELGRSFVEVDFTNLQEILPKLLTETLEIAENIWIERQEHTVTVEIIDSIFAKICQETNCQPRTHEKVGCLLSSALACILAKATRKPITIRNEISSPETKTTMITYDIEEE